MMKTVIKRETRFKATHKTSRKPTKILARQRTAGDLLAAWKVADSGPICRASAKKAQILVFLGLAPPKTSPLEGVCEDVQKLILTSIDSPRDFLAYTSASPIALRLVQQHPEYFLGKLLGHILSLTAARTGVLVHHLVKLGSSASLEDLGGKVAEIQDTDFCKLDQEVLIALFRMALYHEPIVEHCLTQPWLDPTSDAWLKISMYGSPLHDEGDEENVHGHLVKGIQLPETETADVSLHARVYSASFIAELYWRISGNNYKVLASES